MRRTRDYHVITTSSLTNNAMFFEVWYHPITWFQSRRAVARSRKQRSDKIKRHFFLRVTACDGLISTQLDLSSGLRPAISSKAINEDFCYFLYTFC